MLVLIIEDDPHIRNNIIEILQFEGYDTVSASNGKDGIQTALSQSPDIIFCDLMMPHMDGYEVLEILKSSPATQNIPFIFVTARTETETIQKGMEMGAFDFLLKPFKAETIFKMLKSIT